MKITFSLINIVYSFTELAERFLKANKKCFILSERFNQDPLEAFFGKQRARGGRSDNPTAKRFLENTQAIRVGRSLALGGSSNIQQANNIDISELSQPLKKKRKQA